MSTILALTILVTLAALAGRAGAHTTSSHDRPWLERHPGVFKERVWDRRATLRQIRRAKCRPAPSFRPELPRQVLVQWRGHYLTKASRRNERNRGYRSRCQVIPAWPWLALASCESGRDWDYNGGSGFDGGFQFLPSTWTTARQGITGYAYAWQAPSYVQYLVARSWLARTSWLQWPVCSAQIGAR